ncbi:MAG: acyl-CoA thioesterase [Anaerolineae bacterium]
MAEMHFFYPMEVRYGDLDPQGHLNNAKFLTYFEQARIRYFEELGLFSKDTSFMDIGVIVADIHIRYRAPVFMGADVRVGVRTTAIGSKSITMEESIVDGETGKVYADGTVVLVTYDYHAHKTIPVTEEWRTKLRTYEGTFEGTKEHDTSEH